MVKMHVFMVQHGLALVPSIDPTGTNPFFLQQVKLGSPNGIIGNFTQKVRLFVDVEFFFVTMLLGTKSCTIGKPVCFPFKCCL